MPIVSVRGATTCSGAAAEDVLDATRELVLALCRANPGLTPASALAAFFTVTPDLGAAFPAAAARALGFTETAMLGAVEAAVPGAPERCVRALFLYETGEDGAARPARHGVSVYLGEAARLRPDLGRPHGPAEPASGREVEA